MPRKKKNEPEKQTLQNPESQPNQTQKSKKDKAMKTDGSSSTDTGKLGELKAKIQREQALKDAENVHQTRKEAEILSPASPSPAAPDGAAGAFVCSPIMLDVSAGVTFHIMRKIVNMFQKDLTPLNEAQKEQVKGLLAYYAETYLPAALAKYQRAGDAVFVIGGILMMNITDLKPLKEDKKPADEKPAPTEAPQEAPQPYQTGTPTLPSPAPLPRPEVQE